MPDAKLAAKKKKPKDPLHPYNIFTNVFISRSLILVSNAVTFSCLAASFDYKLVNDPFRIRLIITILMSVSIISFLFACFSLYKSSRWIKIITAKNGLYTDEDVVMVGNTRLVNYQLPHDIFMFLIILVLTILAQRWNFCAVIPMTPYTQQYTQGNEVVYFCNEYKISLGFSIVALIVYVWVLVQDFFDVNTKTPDAYLIKPASGTDAEAPK